MKRRKKKTVMVRRTVYFTEQQSKLADRLAWQEDRKMSEIIRIAFDEKYSPKK